MNKIPVKAVGKGAGVCVEFLIDWFLLEETNATKQLFCFTKQLTSQQQLFVPPVWEYLVLRDFQKKEPLRWAEFQLMLILGFELRKKLSMLMLDNAISPRQAFKNPRNEIKHTHPNLLIARNTMSRPLQCHVGPFVLTTRLG